MSDAKSGTKEAKTILESCFLDFFMFRPAHNTELVVFFLSSKESKVSPAVGCPAKTPDFPE